MTVLTKTRTRSRKVEARDCNCPYHDPKEPVQAEDFCGVWINDGSNDGRGIPARVPLCRNCADIRLQVWVCPRHQSKKEG